MLRWINWLKQNLSPGNTVMLKNKTDSKPAKDEHIKLNEIRVKVPCLTVLLMDSEVCEDVSPADIPISLIQSKSHSVSKD